MGQPTTPSTLPLDHLVYAVPDLEAAVRDLERRVGVRAAPGGRHEGLGTHNALLGLGPGSYLELIAPDPEQPDPSGPRPFDVDRAGSGRLVAWAVRCTDIDAAIARARENGYDPGDAVPLQRATASGEVLHWRLTLNALAGGPVPFLIDWAETPHPSSTAPAGLVLDSFHLEHPAPDELRAALEAVGADVPVQQSGATALVARVTGPHGAVTLAGDVPDVDATGRRSE